jgi:hypothetical protein
MVKTDNIKTLIIALLVVVGLASCQDQNVYETGLYNGKVDKNMLDYMRGDSYNWDSTVLVIERAGLEDLFEGNDPEHPQITFLGCTNLSILRYMLPQGYNSVSEMSQSECKDLILRHVIDGTLLRDDLTDGNISPRNGGENYETLAGTEVWLCKHTQSANGTYGAGPTVIYVYSNDYDVYWDVASSNIETNTGVVHSLEYAYIFGNL